MVWLRMRVSSANINRYNGPLFDQLYAEIAKLDDIKYSYMSCYSSDIQHYDIRTTSPGEGSHRQLQEYLGNANLSFLAVVEKSQGRLREEVDEVMIRYTQQRSRVMQRHPATLGTVCSAHSFINLVT
jgi:hypothetical protein